MIWKVRLFLNNRINVIPTKQESYQAIQIMRFLLRRNDKKGLNYGITQRTR